MEQLKTFQRAIEPGDKLLNLLHKHIPYLRKQWIVFCEMVEEYGEHAENCMNEPRLRINTKTDSMIDEKKLKLRREHNEAIRKFNDASERHDHKAAKHYDKLRQEKQDVMVSLELESKPQPPEPDCVRHHHSNFWYLNVPVGHIYWITPEVVNPLLWFNFFGNAPIQKDPTKQERFIIDCALLAVAHDQDPELRYSEKHIYHNKNYIGRYFKRNSFCQGLYANLDDGQIKRAFDRIKTELNSQPDKGGGEKPKVSAQGKPETKKKYPKMGSGEEPKGLMIISVAICWYKIGKRKIYRLLKDGDLTCWPNNKDVARIDTQDLKTYANLRKLDDRLKRTGQNFDDKTAMSK